MSIRPTNHLKTLIHKGYEFDIVVISDSLNHVFVGKNIETLIRSSHYN